MDEIRPDYRKLQGRIKELGYTQRKVAKRLGIKEGRLSEIFNGDGELNFSKIKKITKLLELNKEEWADMFLIEK